MVTESSNQNTFLIYNFQIRIMIFVLRLSSKSFCILSNITTVDGITHRGHGWKCIFYECLIVINLRIVTELLCGGGVIIWHKVKGGCRDFSDQLVDNFNPCDFWFDFRFLLIGYFNQHQVLTAVNIVDWSLGYMYHNLDLHLPLKFIDSLKREKSMGPEGAIGICPDQEVRWKSNTNLLPHDDYWIGWPNSFNIFSHNAGLCSWFYLLRL